MAIQISIFLCKARCIFMISSSFDIFVVYDMLCERLFDALSDIPKIHDLVHLIWKWVWFQEAVIFFLQQNCVHYTDLGQKIGKEPGVVYVSTTQGRKWMELAEFAQNRDGEDYLFLEHQLELFGDLCHVSVKFCNFWRTVCLFC